MTALSADAPYDSLFPVALQLSDEESENFTFFIASGSSNNAFVDYARTQQGVHFNSILKHLMDKRNLDRDDAWAFSKFAFDLYTEDDGDKGADESFQRGMKIVALFLYMCSVGFDPKGAVNPLYKLFNNHLFDNIGSVLYSYPYFWDQEDAECRMTSIRTIGDLRRIAGVLIFVTAVQSSSKREDRKGILREEPHPLSNGLIGPEMLWMRSFTLTEYVSRRMESARELGVFVAERGIGSDDEEVQYAIDWYENEHGSSSLKNGAL